MLKNNKNKDIQIVWKKGRLTMANTVTNANGIIAQAAQAQMEASKPKKPGAIMQSLLDNEQTKKILQNALHENADSYAASILDLYNSDKTLQQCQPKLVLVNA